MRFHKYLDSKYPNDKMTLMTKKFKRMLKRKEILLLKKQKDKYKNVRLKEK